MVKVLADADPDPQVLDELHWIYGVEPHLELVSAAELEASFDELDRYRSETAEELIASLRPAGGEEIRAQPDDDLLARTQEAPVVRLVNLLLSEALTARASDVHLESAPAGVTVRYRVDGVLRAAPAPPNSLAPAVVGRLKVMAELDVAERRRPQDGRVRLRTAGRSVDVRVSTIPTLHGESVVLRLLEAEGRRLGMDELGMDSSVRDSFEAMVMRPHGVVLATGPTGSGKTTTLYGALDRLRTGREKIITVEDPVEYELPGIAQVPVNRKAGVTFASALRAILRQDPDVILVGEMRDGETAEICTQAALTGHMVLSTVHTNDAPGALVRLQDLGIEPYLVTSTVEGVLAQRLVRTVCGLCRDEWSAPPAVAVELEKAGFSTERLCRGAGCSECDGTGYRGRAGLYELLPMDDDIRAEVIRRRGAALIRALAREKGMRSLRHDGWRQVAAGVTTPDEVFRVTRRDGD
jgi:general secretion pathway protein E